MIRAVGDKRAQRELKAAQRKFPQAVKRGTQVGADKIVQRARQAISQRLSDDNRRRHGRGGGLGSWTGDLRAAISWGARRLRNGWRVEVGPTDDAIWGWIHETGAGRYPRRPWFRALAEKEGRRIAADLDKRFKRVL